jgi:hypothetical protein
MDLTPPPDQAVYIPSVTPNYAEFVHADDPKRPMPSGVQLSDLNFLDDGSDLFHVGHVMSSAGQAMDKSKPCIISERDRTKTMMIGDSGGFQIIGGVLDWKGDKTRKQILLWLEANADWAMTLDVPTRAPENPKSGFKSFRDCLNRTIENLDYFRDKRSTKSPLKLLNVLQGENHSQANIWFDAVKHYPFEGWAFAGRHRLNLKTLCRRVIQMADQKLLDDRDWIHVLGTNRLTMALGLTALQRAINDHINPRLRISYDTSSPFSIVARWRQLYALPVMEQKRAVLQSSVAPDELAYVGNSTAFPWPSPIGDRLTMGDICIKGGNFEDTRWDDLSIHMMQNHNFAGLLLAIRQAHQIFDMETDFANRHLPPNLIAQNEVVGHVIKSMSIDELNRNTATLSAFAVKEKDAPSWLDGEDTRELE